MNPEMGDAAKEGFLGQTMTQRAVVHIGANAVSMIIVDQTAEKPSQVEVLEFLEQPVPLARDVFRDDELARGTIETCVRILGRFEVALREYGLQMQKDVEGVATNILSEADNSELLFNRLQVACGLNVRPLDEGDMTRLIYLSVARILKEHGHLRKSRLLAVHLGPGNTRLMLFNRGRIDQYASYRMGAHRVVEAIERYPADSGSVSDLIKGHINGTIEQIEEAYVNEKIDAVLAIGQEIEPVARHLTEERSVMEVEEKAVRRFIKQLRKMKDKEISSLLDVNAHSARVVTAGMLGNVAIVEKLGLSRIHVPGGRFEERFLTGLAGGEFSTKRFANEVIQSARALGKKYLYDRKHGQHVAMLAVTLFDELTDYLGLLPQDRLLLEVAAIVHEVGSFISRRSHHKHSLYIIRNSEIFGLNDQETRIVALVARYHRQALPQLSHPFMRELTREERIRVSMLAALLRVADALDRSHTQRIQLGKVRIEKNALLLHVGRSVNVSVEELALQGKADLFERVFGLDVVLETG